MNVRRCLSKHSPWCEYGTLRSATLDYQSFSRVYSQLAGGSTPTRSGARLRSTLKDVYVWTICNKIKNVSHTKRPVTALLCGGCVPASTASSRTTAAGAAVATAGHLTRYPGSKYTSPCISTFVYTGMYSIAARTLLISVPEIWWWWWFFYRGKRKNVCNPQKNVSLLLAVWRMGAWSRISLCS